MPGDYLHSLRIGHQEILEAIDAVEPFLRSYHQAKPCLRRLYQSMENFLGRQDKAMFDALYQFFEHDRPSKKMIDFLAHDLKDMKVQYLIFADKHPGDMSDYQRHTFPRDFSEFSARIIARLKIEQEYLFPLFEKMCA